MRLVNSYEVMSKGCLDRAHLLCRCPFRLISFTSHLGGAWRDGQPILFIPHCTHKFYSQRTAAFEGYFNYEVSWVLSTKGYYDLIGANRREAQLHAMRCRHLSASGESYETILGASPSIKSDKLVDKNAHFEYICETHWDLISSFILRRRVVR